MPNLKNRRKRVPHVCNACQLLTPDTPLEPVPRLHLAVELPRPCRAWREVSTPADLAAGLRIFVPSD